MTDSGIPSNCPHERRPGTTTCLYCLQEERARARARHRRAFGRFALAVFGGGAAIALVIGGITALAPDSSSVAVAPDSPAVNQTGSVVEPEPVREPSVVPVIAAGSKDLGDGVVATRSNGQVIVNFDTDLLRTRFDWKFEGVVRSTLPLVFGEPARIALDSVPSGQLIRGDLLEALPERGIPLAMPGVEGDTLMLWPLTRPGRDGPIVVAYRVAAAR